MKNPIPSFSKIAVTAAFALASLGGMVATQTAPASAQPYYHHHGGGGYNWHGRRWEHRRWHPGYYGPAHRWHAGFYVYF